MSQPIYEPGSYNSSPEEPVVHQTISSGGQKALWSDDDDSMRNDASASSQALSGVSSAPTGRSSVVPDGAKRPQDHRKPTKRTVIINGMDIEINLKRLQDDWEIMEMMAEMEGSGDEENLPLVIKLVKAVVGDQYDMVKKNSVSDEGYVSTEKMLDVIRQIFEEVGELGE